MDKLTGKHELDDLAHLLDMMASAAHGLAIAMSEFGKLRAAAQENKAELSAGNLYKNSLLGSAYYSGLSPQLSAK